MSRKLQVFRRNMLIICEGEVTEPEYFARLRRMAIDEGVWAEIVIKPKPRSEEESTPTHTRSTHKSARPKRKLIEVPIHNEVDPIEKKYDVKSQPISWIKEARDNLKDEAFEEVWAVFDDDGRTKTEDAFLLAREKINGKVVNIAFSSIAFEHWILLHFERNANAFKKSLCRTGDKIHECGSDTSTDDCGGTHCLVGYMRHNNYLLSNSSTKKTDAFSELLEHITKPDIRQIGYTHAAWLRYVVPHDPLKPYRVSPFTNVDTLVQRLLGEEQIINWSLFNQKTIWEQIEIEVQSHTNKLIIHLTNTGARSRLLNGIDLDISITSDSLKQSILPSKEPILYPSKPKEVIFDFFETPKTVIITSKSSILTQLFITEV